MLVSTGAAGGDIAFGKAKQGSNGGEGVPVISHNGFGQANTDADALKVPAKVVLTTADNASTGAPTMQNVGGIADLDWGRWDNVQLAVKSNQLATPGDARPPQDLMWAVFKPVAAPTTGTFRYGNNAAVPISGVDSSGGALRGGSIEFDIDFAGGVDAISNGSIVIFDSSNATWSATFNGDITTRTIGAVTGTSATMTDISGTLNGAGSLTGAMGGVFTTGAGPQPDFVGGFSLKADSGGFVQGITLLNDRDCFSCAVTLIPQ
jgi:hypothetical protein